MKKATVKYKSLSKNELYLISRAEFEKQEIITTKYVRKLFGGSKKAANILDKLTRKGRLIQIERGKYIVVPIKAPNQLWAPNEFITGGFTEQIPQTVFVLNTKKSCVKTIGNVRYKAVKIDKKKYYGIKKIKIDREFVCISDKERTLVDFIYNPIGTFENVRKVLDYNLKRVNIDKFIRYLISFPVISVRKRAGYILERLNCQNFQLRRLQKTIGNKTTYIVLNPANPSRRGNINKDWRIIVNDPIKSFSK